MRNTQSKPFRLATATDWKRIREIADRKDIVLNLQNSIHIIIIVSASNSRI